MTPIDQKLEQACKDYAQYVQTILRPAMTHLMATISAGNVALHQVFGANLFVAHAVDYIQAIRLADGKKENRSDLVRQFDRSFAVTGARIRNRKFELIDAINNALKHIRLKPEWYKEVEQKYGSISFQSLVEENGRVLCVLNGYRFDYTRVVLRPAYQALAEWRLEAVEDILEFARAEVTESDLSDSAVYLDSDDLVGDGRFDSDELIGDCSELSLVAPKFDEDAIDQMTHYCNPICDDCGEGESDCLCAKYVYKGEQGHFESRFQGSFDFDNAMSQISGAYRRDGD